MTTRRSLFPGAALILGGAMLNRGRFQLFAKTQIEYSVRTLDLVRSSTVIDMLGLLTLDYRKLTTWESTPGNFRQTDFDRLKASGTTIFHPAVGYTTGDIYAESLRDITGWNTFLKANKPEFLRIDTTADFERARQTGALGILIGQQNSSHFRTVDDVDQFYKLGQRVSQLTYLNNRLGGGSPDPRNPGLTEYGAAIVGRMNSLGMAVDISHCSDHTSQDAIETSGKPVLITHSNCRTLVPGSSRCKTDEVIRKMAAKGGVMGVTMVRPFVSAKATATIANVLDHIDHVAHLAGIEHVGLGSDVDLDGRDGSQRPAKKYDLDGVNYATKIYDITEGLVRRNYSDQNIALILGGNFRRALSEIWTA